MGGGRMRWLRRDMTSILFGTVFGDFLFFLLSFRSWLRIVLVLGLAFVCMGVISCDRSIFLDRAPEARERNMYLAPHVDHGVMCAMDGRVERINVVTARRLPTVCSIETRLRHNSDR